MSLIAQQETARGQWYFGIELFHDAAEDYYTTRFHARTYDEIKVASSYTTGEIRLDAMTKESAWREALKPFAQFQTLYRDVA